MTSFSPQVLCRPALPADEDQVMEFLKDIWQGEDYVPGEWEIWLYQEPGCLAVAELEGQVVGVGHLLDMGHGEWWLEGLRVQPDYWDQGIGSSMHDYFIERWLDSPGRVVRLATHEDREPVHKMCRRTGFQAIAEVTVLKAEPKKPAGKVRLALAASPDWPDALKQIEGSPLMRQLSGLMDFQWRFAQPEPDRLSGEFDDRILKGESGPVSLLRVDDEGEQRFAHLLASSASLDELREHLEQLRGWAADNGVHELQWLAPNLPRVLQEAEAAGFSLADMGTLIIFERRR